MRFYKDPLFNFVEYFNEDTGALLRTNVLDSDGVETNLVPRFRSYPELIDVGIMGKCSSYNKWCQKFGVHCYQGESIEENMTFNDFKRIIDQSKGKTFQIALGGRGDPNKHQHFEQICKYASENHIVPNLTTSGYDMTESEIATMKKYCGAVAVSLYSKIIDGRETNPESINVINNLVNAGIKTNIHYVVSKETIEDATFRIVNNAFPRNVNAVIFLLYKPIGLGNANNVLSKAQGLLVEKFFEAIRNSKGIRFGFDSCFVPLLIDNLMEIDDRSIEYCEASRFSCYITPDMKIYPCSFFLTKEHGCDLTKMTIQDAWLTKEMRLFTKSEPSFCKSCLKKCRGGCQENLNQTCCLTTSLDSGK